MRNTLARTNTEWGSVTDYDSMVLRAAAAKAVADPAGFERLLDFVEWTGLLAPQLAIEHAREMSRRMDDTVRNGTPRWWMRDCQECRLALETAVRYQHSAGDALARLLFSVLVDPNPPFDLHLSTFERGLAQRVRDVPPVAAARRMRTSDDWLFLSAFCNTLKHVSLVEPNFHISLGLDAEIEAAEFEFLAFEFKGRQYAPISQDGLEKLLARCRGELTDVLNLLREQLLAGASG